MTVVGVDHGVPAPARDQIAVHREGGDGRDRQREGEAGPEAGRRSRRPSPSTASRTALSMISMTVIDAVSAAGARPSAARNPGPARNCGA
jgi:hypothetical protein